MKSKTIIILLTVAIVFAIGFISIYVFDDYGWTLFVFLPFLIGFLPSYFANRKLELTKKQAYALSFSSLFILLAGLLVFGVKGMIFITMTLPILALIVWISAYFGYIINKRKSRLSRAHLTIILSFYSLSFLSFDYINEPESLTPVTTSIIINAPIEVVWDNVVRFDTVPKSDDFVFKAGIAYPINATLEGSGVGAVRKVNFTTGKFVESITLWDKPDLLQFSITSNTAGLREWNPFWDIRTSHEKNYYNSCKGEFKLERTSNNVTLLEETTWYKVDVYPQIYWKIWANTIIQKIHFRVLEHIKSESEEQDAQSRNTPKII